MNVMANSVDLNPSCERFTHGKLNFHEYESSEWNSETKQVKMRSRILIFRIPVGIDCFFLKYDERVSIPHVFMINIYGRLNYYFRYPHKFEIFSNNFFNQKKLCGVLNLKPLIHYIHSSLSICQFYKQFLRHFVGSKFIQMYRWLLLSRLNESQFVIFCSAFQVQIGDTEVQILVFFAPSFSFDISIFFLFFWPRTFPSVAFIYFSFRLRVCFPSFSFIFSPNADLRFFFFFLENFLLKKCQR